MKNGAPFTVIFEDENILAVNKAAGVAVGGDRWNPAEERLDMLVAEEMGLPKLFTVHRIDRDTSGLVVFAKDEETHRRLSLAFEGRDVGKRYIAVVCGRPLWKETACDLPLVPDGNKRHETIIDKYGGKASLTRFRLLGSAGSYSVLEAVPETGRTHQIRVHAAAIGYPVACDGLYGKNTPVFLSDFKKTYRGDRSQERPLLSRLGLHALELVLPARAVLSAPIPKDMISLIKQMEKYSSVVIIF